MASSALSRPFKRLYRGGLKVLAFSSVAAAAVVWYDYKTARDADKNSPKQTEKKKILVLPFHRMKLVEQKPKLSFPKALASLDDGDEEKIIEVEVKDLVETIHAAAADPNVVALYGKFGHGFGFSAGGWAHVEEVRNALRVFKESHRVHWEPNKEYNSTPARRGNETEKRMFAYADTFANPMDVANKEYFLASIFPRIHLQEQGEVNLFGSSVGYPFLRGALDKYGIKVHVFKHGKYKNAPNMFTERGYVKDHLENTKSLIESLNDSVCDGLLSSRRTLGADFDLGHLWNTIHGHGTFSSQRAHELGLVDYLPRLDPLESLVESNKNEKAKEGARKKWGSTETDVDKFIAEEAVSLSRYSALVKKRKSLEQRKLETYSRLRHLSDKYSFVESLLASAGYPAPYFNVNKEDYEPGMDKARAEKIALVRVAGTISNDVARKTVNSLRKIKKDDKVKCVILRVDSPGGSATAAETIFQELKDIPQPSVCSMGNTAASAGYYIASNCDRIYALPTTFTGSIGVFGIKLDATGMAKQYGVKVEHVVAGPLSSSNSLFQPLTKPIKDNYERSVARVYDCFKSHVATGRNMSVDHVEEVAQGRVYTGDQARDAGLVDELGDLTRVIGHVNRNYTSGYAQVEVWPKHTSFGEKLKKLSQSTNEDEDEDDGSSSPQGKSALVLQVFREFMSSFRSDQSHSRSENTNDVDVRLQVLSALLGQPGMFDASRAFPTGLSGIMMTTNENDAMKCLFQESGYMNKSSESSPLLPPNFWQ